MKTYQNKQAFTLIEFIFIILIIAILSSLVINKLFITNQKYLIISCKNDFNIINLAIKRVLQKDILLNNTNTLLSLEDNNILFSNILDNFDSSSWTKISSYEYVYNFNKKNLVFTYNNQNNNFTCEKTISLCQEVLN